MGGRELVGRRVRWTSGENTLVAEATRYDADDDELYLDVEPLMHAHIWVPARMCEPAD
ncbi:hypothetical protein ACFVAJ_18010 [Agromyces sp. NPDC057679]|uniref:hypothetical protein n=1 Tax=Agromyces sp. NPDC057679 TaxID=3346207 RepID=UPI0036700258